MCLPQAETTTVAAPTMKISRGSSAPSRSVSRHLAILLIASFIVWWEPLYLTQPARALHEAAFYTYFLIVFWSGHQGLDKGDENILDRWLVQWMNFNSKHPPTKNVQIEPVRELSAANYSASSFLEVSEHRTKPIVVRGLFHNSAANRLWTAEYLNEFASHVNIQANLGGTKCQRAQIDAVQGRYIMNQSCLTQTTFGEFTTKLLHNQTAYAKQVSVLFAAKPDLRDELELERLTPQIYPVDHKDIPTVFIGHGSEFPLQTSFHSAIAANYFIQVQGHKVWKLLHPRYTPYFQPYFYDSVPGMGSRVSCFDKRSYEWFNRAGLPIAEVTLEPGDFLYVPPWWWHEIEHLQPSEYHLAVGLRPLAEAVWEHIPGLSTAWPNTMGILPSTLRSAVRLFLRNQDWGSQFHWRKEEESS